MLAMFTAPFMRCFNQGLQFSDISGEISEENCLQNRSVTDYGSMNMTIGEIEGRKHQDAEHYNGCVYIYIIHLKCI